MAPGYLAVVITMFMVCLDTAFACDDHVGKCELEAWRAQPTAMGLLSIDGSATCDKGHATIRMYDGDKFLGVATGLVQGHALQAVAVEVPAYTDLKIKYSITPE